MYKSIEPAWNDSNLREIAGQVRTPMLLAHVRASTGTPVQRSNCHPFRHGRWLWVHNGALRGFHEIRRDLVMAVDPTLFSDIEGSTDSEALFFLALTFGLADDPFGAVARAVGFVEDVGRTYGVEHPVQMTVATTDGESLWIFRYSSERQSRSLFFSTEVAKLRALHPEVEVLHELGRGDPLRGLRTPPRPRRRVERGAGILCRGGPSGRRRNPALRTDVTGLTSRNSLGGALAGPPTTRGGLDRRRVLTGGLSDSGSASAVDSSDGSSRQLISISISVSSPSTSISSSHWTRSPTTTEIESPPEPSSTSEPLASACPSAMSRSDTSFRESSDFLLISSLGTATPHLGAVSHHRNCRASGGRIERRTKSEAVASSSPRMGHSVQRAMDGRWASDDRRTELPVIPSGQRALNGLLATAAGDGDVRARRRHIADERVDLVGGSRPRHDRQRRPGRDRARGAGIRRVHPDRRQGRRSHRTQAGVRAGPARLRRSVRRRWRSPRA